MSQEIAEFDIKDRIHTGHGTQVFTAVRREDGRRFIVKVCRNEDDAPHIEDLVKQEFETLSHIDHPGVVKGHTLLPYRGGLALVLEDFGGKSLHRFLHDASVAPALNIRQFLKLAIRLAEALQAVHDARTIHKDINPNNILINPATEAIQLIDFGISSVLPKERQGIANPGALEGTLLYMSPEQTGRMNRSIDYRTDLYSLGATFYEMLTNRPPFDFDDPMEIVHHHIAHEPKPPHALHNGIPYILSTIVLRLMAKAAEDRYQSAAGLRADLEVCQRQFDERGQIEPFPLGEADVSHYFHIPEKLYGREDEIAQLLRAFDRAAAGRIEVMMVSGYSGAGKSALIREVHRPIVRSRGFFISGKFDQLQRGAPFASLHKAFSKLIQQLLTESDEDVSYWRRTLLEALGPNGRLIIENIPEVEYLIGEQPVVAELPPLESQHRFNLVFRRFVRVFCQPEHPVCLFLDDLQWADLETLNWLQDAATDAALGNMFIIGAYRDNEVDSSHPLHVMLDSLREHHAALHELHLEPLDRSTLAQLLADTLSASTEEIQDLADLVQNKTDGNPFFVNQLLETLHRDGAIAYVPETRGWRVDRQAVADAEISDNVIDLMIDRIKQLPNEAQEVLKLAACIGNTFELDTLDRVTKYDRAQVRAHVHTTIREGLVTHERATSATTSTRGTNATTRVYRFLHDRVQQAAHSMVSEQESRATRLRIGRMMRDARTPTAADERLFEIIDHLNAGRSLITDPDERRSLAEFNVWAGIRAKRAAAYVPALAYMEHAWALLPDEVWNEPSKLTLDMLLHRAEIDHLSGNDDDASRLYQKALEHAVDDMDKASVYEKQIHFLTDRARFPEAYDAGRRGAALFGVKLPARFVAPVFALDLLSVKVTLRKRRIEELIDLPTMQDERLVRAVALVSAVLKAAYQCRPELAVHNALKVVKMCLKHGNTADSPIAYLVFGGIFLGGILGDVRSGWSFGRLSLALLEKFDNQQQKAEVNFVNGYFATSWIKPAIEAEEHYRVAYQSGIDTGDIFHASCGCTGIVQGMFMRGAPMNNVLSSIERFMSFLVRMKSKGNIGTLVSARQAIYNLRGETHTPHSFTDHEFDEDAFIAEVDDYSPGQFVQLFYINKMQCLYLWGSYERGVEMAHRSASYLKSSTGMLHSAEHYFFEALLHAAQWQSTRDGERAQAVKIVRRNLKKMTKWETHCTANFEHKRYLLQAELARLEGDNAKASDCYDLAIESATTHGFIQHAAMANEIAGRFYSSIGRRILARFYLANAVGGYRSWGAHGIVDDLPKRFAEVLEGSSIERPNMRMTTLSGTSHTIIERNREVSTSLDLTSVIKSSQVLSGEIQLAQLLIKMMQLVIENAGAQRGVLLLQDRRTLRVQAEHSVESSTAKVLEGTPLEEYPGVAQSIVNYVVRARQNVVLEDAGAHSTFRTDPYVVEHEPRSVLCAPLSNQGQIRGVLYLENNLTVGAFTEDRLEVLKLLSGQIAISIDNALHYEQLEERVAERTVQIERERERSEALLLNILPKQTAEELKIEGRATTRQYHQVSVLFTDFIGFTASVSIMPPEVLIHELDRCFRKFDEVVEVHNQEKIKTIGDSYMCAGGIPVANRTNPIETVLAGLAMQRYSQQFANVRKAKGQPFWTCRIGIHTGPVVAGVVGKKKFAYDIWGDTVNTASRMESSGDVHRVNISGSTYELVRDFFQCTHRGKIHAKGKGEVDMYFVDRILPELSKDEHGEVPNRVFHDRLKALDESPTVGSTTLHAIPTLDPI